MPTLTLPTRYNRLKKEHRKLQEKIDELTLANNRLKDIIDQQRAEIAVSYATGEVITSSERGKIAREVSVPFEHRIEALVRKLTESEQQREEAVARVTELEQQLSAAQQNAGRVHALIGRALEEMHELRRHTGREAE